MEQATIEQALLEQVRALNPAQQQAVLACIIHEAYQ